MTLTPWKARAAALVSALLLAAAFPPLNWWPLALVALVPLLWAVWSLPSRPGRAVPALSQQPHLSVGAGGSTHPVGAQGRNSLAADAVKPTSRPEARAPVFWPGFRLGWLFGFVFFTATLWWIQHVTMPGMLALTCYLALYPAVAFGLTAWLHPGGGGHPWGTAGKLVLALGVWSGLEWVRSVALSGFPWNSLAIPLFDLASARFLAAWTGVIGLSGIVFLIPWTVAWALLSKGRKSWKIIAGGTALAIMAEMAVRFINPATGVSGPVSHQALLIQPNVTMEEKMSPDPEVQRQRYFDLLAQTDEALARADGSDGHTKPGLVVWPESAVPGFFNDMVNGGAFTDQLEQGEFSLVTGADHEEWGALYNSLAVLRGTVENHALHPKVRLVPFGEFIPFRKEVPLFEKMLGGLIPMDFTPGTNLEPMRVKGQPFSIVPLVCFEDTMGNHARKFIRPEPQVIVNVTNDNWFHQSPATEMHFVNARWRAAELNRTLLRSANTGVTAIVSPQGNVQRLPSFKEAVLPGRFDGGHGQLTFYATHGDLFSQVAGAVALLGCAGVLVFRKQRARAAL